MVPIIIYKNSWPENTTKYCIILLKQGSHQNAVAVLTGSEPLLAGD